MVKDNSELEKLRTNLNESASSVNDSNSNSSTQSKEDYYNKHLKVVNRMGHISNDMIKAANMKEKDKLKGMMGMLDEFRHERQELRRIKEEKNLE